MTLMVSLSFDFSLIVSRNFMHATNSCESFWNPISWIRLLMFELLLCFFSGDARAKFCRNSIEFIGIGFHSTVVSVVRRVLVDFSSVLM